MIAFVLRLPRPHLVRCLAVLVTVALLSPSLLSPVQADQFTRVASEADTTHRRFDIRGFAYSFHWAGAIWMAGGNLGVNDLQDVWGSYDFGRTWQKSATLSGPCASYAHNRGVLYNNSVYLVCAGYVNTHGTNDANNDERTYISSDPALVTWTRHTDGCPGCTNFNVERMAVPFDGVGTLIMVNSGLDRSVYWQSATGRFQKPASGLGTMNYWTAFQSGGTTFVAPWVKRHNAATATDAEGLVLVMAGGRSDTGGVNEGDVWQLSWQSDADAPLAYQVTAAGFPGRYAYVLYSVHDWLFICGGVGSSPGLDDVWMSGDYGATWTQFAQAATGASQATGSTNKGRYGASGVSVGRRLFIIGGFVIGEHLTNDVWVGYW